MPRSPMDSIQPAPNERQKFKVGIVNVEDLAEAGARDAAEAKLTAPAEEVGFFQKLWKYNLAREFYRRKELAIARKKIHDTENILAGEYDAKSELAGREELRSVVSRFVGEYDEMVRAEAGETKEVLGAEPGDAKFNTDVKKLIDDYAQGIIDEGVFKAETTRLVGEVAKSRGDGSGKDLYANNLLEIAKQVEASFKHGAGLAALDFDLEVVFGKAKTSVRTEAQFNTVDRITEGIMHSRVGSFFNETTLAAGVAIAYSVATKVLPGVARSKVAAWSTFGATLLISGGVSALRESVRITEDRRQHLREKAKGKEFDPKKSPRRKEMEEFVYEYREAESLTNDLESSLYEDVAGRKMKDLDQAGFEEVLKNIAEGQTRFLLSNQRKIDLIAYTDPKKVEQERTRLEIALAQAKVDLEKVRVAKGLTFPVGGTLKDCLDQQVGTRTKELLGGATGVEQKDALFSKLKTRKVAKAAVKGVLTGLVVGSVVQEGFAFFQNNQTGLVERMVGRGEDGTRSFDDATPLEGIRRWWADEVPNMNMEGTVVGKQHFEFPEDVELVENPDGTGLSLMQDGEVVVDGIGTNPDGSLTSEGRALLEENGVQLSDTEKIIKTSKEIAETIPGSTGAGMGAKEFIAQHENMFTKIKRVLWYDNDTPKPIFDKNELKLWWGGAGNTGIDANGNFSFDVSHMKPDGSFHDEFSANAKELMASGKLKMLLSLSRDTQNQVFEVDIDPSGKMVIPKDSEIAKLFFKEVEGKAVFMGRFAEVGQAMDSAEGAPQGFRILSTHEGPGLKDIPGGTIIRKTIEEISTVPMTTMEMSNYIDPPFFIPLFGRTPLEPPVVPIPYSGYMGMRADQKKYEGRRSENIAKNPNEELDPYKEGKAYMNRQSAEWKKEINELNAQIDQPMDARCKAVVCIPVAGHQEGNNIYNTLEWYKGQKDPDGNLLDPSLYEIILFVNHPKDVKPDNTLDEIKRFKSEHPNMNVRVIYKPLDRPRAKIGRIRKMVSDTALLRNINRGAGAGEVVVISNDADCKGMSPKYLSTLMGVLESHPTSDAVLGKIDWEPEAYVKAPLLHIGTRFFQYLDIVYRHHKNREVRGVGSSGANFAFKSSIYSAVGGYIEDDSVAEDKHLGEAIKSARRGTKRSPIWFGGADSMVVTNARRGVDAIQRGLSPAEQWGTDFGPDDSLRKLGWDISEEVKLGDPAYEKKLKEGLERFIKRTLKLYELSENSWEAKKAVGFLGVKYEVNNGRLVIKDISKLVERLKEYKKTGVEIVNKRIGVKNEEPRESKAPEEELVEENKPVEAPEKKEEKEEIVSFDKNFKPNMEIELPYRIPKEDALARIKTLLGQLKKEHKDDISDLRETWSKDVGAFSCRIKGWKVEGRLIVKERTVRIEGKIPFAARMFEDRIKKMIKHKSETLLA